MQILQTTLLLIFFFAHSNYASQQEDLSTECKNQMQAQNYTLAQHTAASYIKLFPEDIRGYFCQDAACNSSEKCTNSAKNGRLVKEIWRKYYKAEFEAKGRPFSSRTWARKITEIKNWFLVGSEHYEPLEIGEDKLLATVYYQFLARDKHEEKNLRVFGYECIGSTRKDCTLFEYQGKNRVEIRKYTNPRMDLFSLQSDIERILEVSK